MRQFLAIILIVVGCGFLFSYATAIALESDTSSYTTVNPITANTDQYVKHSINGNHYTTNHYNVRNHKENRNPNSAVNILDRMFGIQQVR